MLEQMSVAITGDSPHSSDKLFGNDVQHKRKELQRAKKRARMSLNDDNVDSGPCSPTPSDDEDVDETVEEDADTKTQRFMNAIKELATQGIPL